MRIAIVGCGQLSRMLALAGIPMGLKFSFVADPGEDTRCVDGLGTIVPWQPDMPMNALYEALERPDRLTIEKEQVDVALLASLQDYCAIYPNSVAVSACQHRHREKELLDKLEIPCAAYAYGQPADAQAAQIPLPLVVKSCREGYDGKNQWVLKSQEDVDAFNPEAREDNYIVEQWIPFDREISQVSVRSVHGEIRHYPLAENHHEKGILKESVAPAADTSEQLQSAAQDYMRQIMETLDYVGVMAMECFVTGDGLLVNELAPRVHNSGHWTEAGSATSQFENHVRAVAELPLGSTESCGVTGMINLIGTASPPFNSLTDRARLHWYDKVVRPGRKLGHVNFTDTTHESLIRQMRQFQDTALC